MSYTHFTKVSAEEAFAVGAQTSERDIIDSSGLMYVPKRTSTGAIAYAAQITTTLTKKGTFTKAVNTITLTQKVTLTRPVGFYKVKVVGKTGANAAIKGTVKLNGVQITKTTVTKSVTSAETASTNTVMVTGKGLAPVFTYYVQGKLDATLTGTNTKKCTLSVPVCSASALYKYTIPKI